MALINPIHASEISGSVGGNTFARSSQGIYMRSRSKPVYPASPAQVVINNALATLVNRWTTHLTQTQRNAWHLYSRNVTVVNKIGMTVKVSGQNWYIGSNTPRLQAQSLTDIGDGTLATPSLVDDGPDTFNRGNPALPSAMNPYVDASKIELSPNSLDVDDDDIILVYQGKPHNQAREYFRGPYRLVYCSTAEDLVSKAPVSITPTGSTGYIMQENQAVRLRFAVLNPDGRYSTPLTTKKLIVQAS